MIVKTVKVSDKGQISIPRDIRESAGIKKGTELVIIQENSKILIEKIEVIPKILKDDFRDLLTHSEKIAKKLWDNEADEIWNDV